MYTLFMGEHLPTSGERMSGPYVNLFELSITRGESKQLLYLDNVEKLELNLSLASYKCVKKIPKLKFCH